VDLQIRPNMLRISYPRRKNKKDLEPDVPTVDVPQGWGKFLDVVRVDFVCPAEHTLLGEKFDCEIRIYVIQKAGRGVPVITLLAKVGKFNNHLQEALDEFQKVWESNDNACQKSNRNLRSSQLGSKFDNETNTRTLVTSNWNPWKFMQQTKSYWFYGYNGGLTEPPCSYFLHWRIIDTPIELSEEQLQQMKQLIMTNRDPINCKYTSVHNQYGSFARPLQDSSRLLIHRCTCREYLSDSLRDLTGLRTCPAGAESLWMPNPRDLKPSAKNLIGTSGEQEEDP